MGERDNLSPKDLTLWDRGYLRCEFDFEEGEECLGCNRTPGAGAKQYYVRTNWECEEGEYYCRRCAFDRSSGRGWRHKPYLKRQRPMHGAGWALLHGMKNWENIYWSRQICKSFGISVEAFELSFNAKHKGPQS